MAFGKSDPTEVLGMSQDEFKAKLGEIDSLKSELTQFRDAHKQTSDTILQRLEELKPKPPQEDLSFVDDPDFDKRIQPLADQTLANTIMLQHDAARKRFAKDFDRWGTEIVKKMGELSPQQQANAAVWDAMVKMVRGDHAEELEKAGAEGKFSFLEPVSAGLRPAPSSDNLNAAQRLMVRKLSTLGPKGMTPEKYKAGEQRLQKARSARLGEFAEVG